MHLCPIRSDITLRASRVGQALLLVFVVARLTFVLLPLQRFLFRSAILAAAYSLSGFEAKDLCTTLPSPISSWGRQNQWRKYLPL